MAHTKFMSNIKESWRKRCRCSIVSIKAWPWASYPKSSYYLPVKPCRYGECDIEWPQPLNWTPPYYTFRFCLYQDWLLSILFSKLNHVALFRMGIVILSGIHKKWIVLEWFLSNTQIISSVRFPTHVVKKYSHVVKKYSVCDRSDQNLGFEGQGPLMLWYRNRGDIIGTLVCCSSVLQ